MKLWACCWPHWRSEMFSVYVNVHILSAWGNMGLQRVGCSVPAACVWSAAQGHTDTGPSSRVMHSQSLIHTWSTPRNVISLKAACQLSGSNEKGEKNRKDKIKKEKKCKKKTKECRKEEEREGDVFLSREHNTGGVKFQQALMVQGHIPAKGMCGQGVCVRATCHHRALWATPQQLTSDEGWGRGAGQRVRWRWLCKVSDVF